MWVITEKLQLTLSLIKGIIGLRLNSRNNGSTFYGNNTSGA
jgi:hypothetical protein